MCFNILVQNPDKLAFGVVGSGLGSTFSCLLFLHAISFPLGDTLLDLIYTLLRKNPSNEMWGH